MDVILKEHKQGLIRISPNTEKRVAKLGVVAARIALKTYPYLKSFNEYYFNLMGFTVFEPWRNIRPLRKLSDDNFVYKPQKFTIEDMEEEKQDRCFNALAGDKKKGLAPCTVPDECWIANTKPGQTTYYLTHQLLYFLMGEVKGKFLLLNQW